MNPRGLRNILIYDGFNSYVFERWIHAASAAADFYDNRLYTIYKYRLNVGFLLIFFVCKYLCRSTLHRIYATTTVQYYIIICTYTILLRYIQGIYTIYILYRVMLHLVSGKNFFTILTFWKMITLSVICNY